MASTESRQTQAQAGAAPTLGKEGETCAGCGNPLATDQRYCLNCGRRRAEPRVPFDRYLAGGTGSENGLARGTAGTRQWNPLAAAALIALLGIMLLVGVLIGKDENDEQAPAPTAPAASPTPTTAAPAVPPPTTATPVPPASTPAPPEATGETGGGAAGQGGAAQTPGGALEGGRP
jgi:hypothetical protein